MNNKIRLHMIALPHTSTTKDFCSCAYTDKVRKAVGMFSSLPDYEVHLYGAGETSTNPTTYTRLMDRMPMNSFSDKDPAFAKMNQLAIESMNPKRDDLILIIGGWAQKPIADAFPYNKVIEFGIGYGGVFAPYQVYESYAWLHCVLGAQTGGNAHSANGNSNYTVIPNYFEIEDFPVCTEPDDYYLFIGRLIERKGIQIASDICKSLGKCLLIAGEGRECRPKYGEYLGLLGPEARGLIMSGAKAVFVPTKYVEPFGGVAVEAMCCGTPVITSDFGAFTETVIDGITGYRCRTREDFTEATLRVGDLDRAYIANYARQRYSTETIKHMYDRYFRWVAMV